MDRSQGKLRSMTSVYLMDGDSILLLHRHGSRVVNDLWIGSAGGHFEEWELNDARACVLRELREELGLSEKDLSGLRMRYITLRHTGGEVRQNYYFFANLKGGTGKKLRSDEGDLKWLRFDDGIFALEMPFTARRVLRHYMDTGRQTSVLYGGLANEEGVTFVELPEMQ